ncbi:hypothetical protein, partial [Nocardia farcinica]|uniref:hypothetical protein n=1 Tax=Nocardia farcinica TaxID=37329 RepID=UPI002453F331
MHYIDTVKGQVSGVKEQVTDLVGKVAGTVGSRTSAQTLTVAAPRERIAAFWRDPASLSQVLGEFGAVSCPEPDRYDWTLRRDGEEIATWHTTLSTDADGLRYTGAAAAGVDAHLHNEIAEAPADLGTQVTLRVTAPGTAGWPDDPDTVEAARAHPEVFAGKTVGQVADHFAAVIERLDRT